MILRAGCYLLATLKICSVFGPSAHSRPKTFSPRYADHDIPGCPLNSICNHKTAQKYLVWNRLKQAKNRHNMAKKIEAFRRTHGLPVGVWAVKALPEGAFWDAPCLHLRELPSPILIGETFLKSFSPKSDRPSAKFWPTPLIVKIKGKITQYWAPLKARPISIQKKSIDVLMEDEGLAYTLRILAHGAWKVRPFKSGPIDKAPADCPADMVAQFAKNKIHQKIFRHYFCDQYRDSTTNITATVLAGKDC